MTQPISLTKTFDTSLVDVQRSFSSTETNTSGSSAKENVQPQPTELLGSHTNRPPSPFTTVSAEELYQNWASTYDTDGNVLQAVDDVHLRTLMPRFVELIYQSRGTDSSNRLRILDLGCGTGRNTLKLIQLPWTNASSVELVGWDGCQAMLDIAQRKCTSAVVARRPVSTKVHVHFQHVDISTLTPQECSNNSFDGMISTLVLEHLPLAPFMSLASALLRPGAPFLLTGMHEDLGSRSSAGYKTESGERFKSDKYIHTVQGVAQGAREAEFETVGDVVEAAVDERMIDGGVVNGVLIEKGAVAERARKYVGTKIWFGMMLRKS